MIPTYLQSSSSRLDYKVNWSTWLNGDTIVASTWSVAFAGAALTGDSFDGSTATVFVEIDPSVPQGSRFDIVNHITTDIGREMNQTLRIKVKAT